MIEVHAKLIKLAFDTGDEDLKIECRCDLADYLEDLEPPEGFTRMMWIEFEVKGVRWIYDLKETFICLDKGDSDE